jgi:integrase
MVYTFARIGAATAMTVGDVYVQNRRLWVNLRERAARSSTCPATTRSRTISTPTSTAPASRTTGPRRCSAPSAATPGNSPETPLPQANAYAMIQRRARAAGIRTRIGNHTFRATGITAYLKNGGTLEKVAAIAHHASTRTTQLYDRRRDEVSLDEVERILI